MAAPPPFYDTAIGRQKYNEATGPKIRPGGWPMAFEFIHVVLLDNPPPLCRTCWIHHPVTEDDYRHRVDPIPPEEIEMRRAWWEENLEKLGVKTLSMVKSIHGQHRKRVFYDLVCTPTDDKDPEVKTNGRYHFSTQTPYRLGLFPNPFLSLEALAAQTQTQDLSWLRERAKDWSRRHVQAQKVQPVPTSATASLKENNELKLKNGDLQKEVEDQKTSIDNSDITLQNLEREQVSAPLYKAHSLTDACVFRKTSLDDQLKQAREAANKQTEDLVKKERRIKALQEELSTQDDHLATIGRLRVQIKTLQSDAERNQDRIRTLETDLANASADSSEKDLSQDDLERISQLETELQDCKDELQKLQKEHKVLQKGFTQLDDKLDDRDKDPETYDDSEQLRNMRASRDHYKRKVEALQKAAKSYQAEANQVPLPQADQVPLWDQEPPYEELPARLMEIMEDISRKQITVLLLNRLAWFAAQDEDILDSHNNVMPVNNIGNAALSYIPATSYDLHASAWRLATIVQATRGETSRAPWRSLGRGFLTFSVRTPETGILVSTVQEGVSDFLRTNTRDGYTCFYRSGGGLPIHLVDQRPARKIDLDHGACPVLGSGRRVRQSGNIGRLSSYDRRSRSKIQSYADCINRVAERPLYLPEILCLCVPIIYPRLLVFAYKPSTRDFVSLRENPHQRLRVFAYKSSTRASSLRENPHQRPRVFAYKSSTRDSSLRIIHPPEIRLCVSFIHQRFVSA
ncbi:hypothetical protein FFLO_05097 [Filobasidium floriforme]|uniref:Uncharacterized protein n=1 Tax=Filobasidium floriforme TaxID=5210 RepID=A0A8K0NP76_9TREE|nr:uncharacterized protein HD553DRAFT_326054 [Filobasidium floriforme]KAG7530381.1 hypothetical protein FFLO_05097 [Filobasidium floriforme]KAH8080674.1 hypothetical protein HD553DRAFT_326054 [Filobasidium floriforme]